MALEVYCGNTGNGKSLELARTGLMLMKRNQQWYKQSGIIRPVVSRLKFAPHVEKKYGDYIRYWKDMMELPDLKGCDVLWDEISTDLDATNWENVPHVVKMWFRQHEKSGVEIYATAQDFKDIYNGARRLTSRMYHMRKMFGSRRPHVTKPPVKRIWGVILKREVKREDYTKELLEARTVSFDWFTIKRADCELYDTLQKIEVGKLPPLEHRERLCNHCGHVKVQHV